MSLAAHPRTFTAERSNLERGIRVLFRTYLMSVIGGAGWGGVATGIWAIWPTGATVSPIWGLLGGGAVGAVAGLVVAPLAAVITLRLSRRGMSRTETVATHLRSIAGYLSLFSVSFWLLAAFVRPAGLLGGAPVEMHSVGLFGITYFVGPSLTAWFLLRNYGEWIFSTERRFS